jgi:hypothetical protein
MENLTVRRRYWFVLDLFQFNRRIEYVNCCVDVVEVDDELAELVLGVLDLARNLCTFCN